MLQVDISATKRTVFGKGEMRRLRMDKQTPAVMYSKGKDAVALQFDEKELYKELLFIHGRNAVVTLDVDGLGKRPVLVQEIQKDPVVELVLHVDFLEIELDQVINFTVPVSLAGAPKGVEVGGELHVPRESVTLRGCPLDVPDELVVDITELERGGAAISCGDLAIPDSVKMLDDPSLTCAAVIN